MKNKILLLIAIILSFIAVSSFPKETTFLNEEVENKELTLAIKNSNTGDITNINLEEYVLGVVAGEMPASFDIEALKAQAIASRTYAIYKMQENKEEYDLITDVTNQVYITKDKMQENWKDNYEYYYDKVKKAVDTTKDLIMKYNDEVICSLYFSTSNGATEDANLVFGGKKDYLKSVSSPENTKETTITLDKDTFCQKLSISCNNIKISNIKKTDSGRINSITINDKEFKGTQIRTKLGLRSTDFAITPLDEKVKITTQGYGHGVGMSQYGANELANQGKTYDEILKYYYQNIEIENFSV